jgi:glycosyltransferase involved in cell wall biosynthesis
LLRDGAAGALPTPADSNAFATVIAELDADREQLHRFRCAAAGAAASWMDIARRTIAFYESLRKG